MSFYDSIYTFINTYIFNSELLANFDIDIYGQTCSIDTVLSYIFTTIVVILLAITLIKLVIWCFNVVKNSFLLR